MIRFKKTRFALFLINLGFYIHSGFGLSLISALLMAGTLVLDEFIERTPKKPEDMPDED